MYACHLVIPRVWLASTVVVLILAHHNLWQEKTLKVKKTHPNRLCPPFSCLWCADGQASLLNLLYVLFRPKATFVKNFVDYVLIKLPLCNVTTIVVA